MSRDEVDDLRSELSAWAKPSRGAFRSLALNVEINLIVYDPGMAQQLRAVLERNLQIVIDWNLLPGNVRSVPRIIQNTAVLMDSFLYRKT
jgi:hypothetical protein